MKKIIYGIKYDTDTAELISECHHECLADKECYCFCRGKLYRKKTGEFFLFGDVDELDKYLIDSSYHLIYKDWYIMPLSLDEAQGIIACHFDADTYESYFGPVSE